MELKRKILAYALASCLTAMSAGAANADVTEELAETRRSITLLRLQMETVKAASELKDLEARSTPEGLARIQAAERAEAEAKRSSAQAQMERPMHERGVSTLQPSVASNLNGLPGVVAVFGAGNRLHASLRYESGVSIDVTVGDQLESGHTLHRISDGDVIVRKNGKNTRLDAFTGTTRGLAEMQSQRSGMPMAQGASGHGYTAASLPTPRRDIPPPVFRTPDLPNGPEIQDSTGRWISGGMQPGMPPPPRRVAH